MDRSPFYQSQRDRNVIAKNTVFGMITTAKSHRFTDGALASFFKTSPLRTGDVFILIDNDNCVNYTVYPQIKLISNQNPRSFAANINMLIDHATELAADLVVLNNDVIFTPGWREALEQRDDIISLPACNQTHVYQDNTGAPVFDQTLDQAQYAGRWDTLCQLAQHHVANNSGYFEQLHTSFYAFRLPKNIYKTVGKFDEEFLPAGGEDVDYRIRALRAGFQTLYTNSAYLLHFQGKSTWDGAEDKTETAGRNQGYHDVFVKKYGEDAAALLLKTGQSLEKIAEAATRYNILGNRVGEFASIVSGMRHEAESVVPVKEVAAPGLLPVIEALGDNLVGCELGVCMGMTLRYFLDNSTKIQKVYAIDAWQPYQDHWGFVTQELIDGWKATAVQLLTPHASRIELVVDNSFRAADRIPRESLDYIFIDGDHCYSAVALDLRRYWNRVRTGGVFAGHDWQLPTVRTAVEHFRIERNILSELHFTENNVWFWYKS